MTDITDYITAALILFLSIFLFRQWAEKVIYKDQVSRVNEVVPITDRISGHVDLDNLITLKREHQDYKVRAELAEAALKNFETTLLGCESHFRNEVVRTSAERLKKVAAQTREARDEETARRLAPFTNLTLESAIAKNDEAKKRRYYSFKEIDVITIAGVSIEDVRRELNARRGRETF